MKRAIPLAAVVLVLVIGAFVLMSRGKPEAKGSEQVEASAAGGKQVLETGQEQGANPAPANMPPAVKAGNSPDLDLGGLVKEEKLEERTVEFVHATAIKDYQQQGRVRGISFRDKKGTGYVFWNESTEPGKFKNGVLAQAGSIRLNQSYKVRGKEGRPYRGQSQFEIKEFIK